MARQIRAEHARAWGSMMSDLARAVSPSGESGGIGSYVDPLAALGVWLSQLPANTPLEGEPSGAWTRVRAVLQDGRWSDPRSGGSEADRLPSVRYSELLNRYGVETEVTSTNVADVLRELRGFTTGGTLGGGTGEPVDAIHGTDDRDPY